MVKLLCQADSPRDWLEQMEQEVLKNGRGTNMDNYTAIGIFTGKPERGRKRFRLF